VPDAVLRVLAAGVGLAAVAVTEARVDAQRDVPARARRELVDHVGRSAVDVHAALDDEVERRAVEDVGRVDDGSRIATGRVPRGERAVQLPGAGCVDEGALAAHEVEHGDVRAGLLRVAHDVEAREAAHARSDDSRVVHERRRAEALGNLGNRNPGNLGEIPLARHGKRVWMRLMHRKPGTVYLFGDVYL
jgi:hypothetical protein